ncbi:hypothetical protein Tco_0775834 [Tanacetum coccineum]
MLMEVEAKRGFVDEIEVFYMSLGRSMKLRVEYPWKPPLCTYCKVFGHRYDKCSNKTLIDSKKIQCAKVRDYWKEIIGKSGNGGNDWQTWNRYGEGTSRGRFNRREIGGFSGRAFGDQRFSRNENSRYVLVKKNSNEVGKDGNGNGQNNKGKNKVDTDTNEVLETKNVFFMFNDDVEDGKKIEWESMKARIDEACEKGLHISKEDREGWNDELYDYYKDKLQELVMKTNVKDLKLKIANLDRQIGHSNRMVAIESRNKVNSRCKSIMVKFSMFELETWSDEKVEFYKNSIREEAFVNTVNQIKRDFNEGMNEDVIEDLSGSLNSWVGMWLQMGLGNTLRQTKVKDFIKDNDIMFFGIIKRKKYVNKVGIQLDESLAQFISYFSSFLGTCDNVFAIEDLKSLFTKNLNNDKDVEMIKPVTNKEIKEALFSIEDNKASGPDAYTDIGVRNYAFKDDIQKAYDTISWDFLGNVLKMIGFYPVMGDPILPYLFTMVMEVLNLMVKRQIRGDRRFKYNSGCQKLRICSIFFTDDLLILYHGDMISASILRRGLDEYSISSGLYPSMSKSNAFFSNIPSNVKEEIKLVTPFREGSLPMTYLGALFVSKRVTKNDCRVLLEVI